MPRRPTPSDRDLVERRELLDEAGIVRVLRRTAHEIVERHPGGKDLALVGIRTGGLHLAERLARLLAAEGLEAPVGAVDITLYRDDVFVGLPRPEVGATELPFSLPGRNLVLVDDVLYTGRTVRAALDVLMDYGRPRRVELAVLVDRGRRELPIQADYVGLKVTTAANESVRVMLRELGEPDRVVVREKVGPGPGLGPGPGDVP
jgi:pyrimidine operon attenuation protein / uracil phosphoribosyltransferase